MVLTIWTLRENTSSFKDLQAEYGTVLQKNEIFFLTRCLSKTIIVFTIYFFVFAEGFDNYFMLMIHYSGIPTKPPWRNYIDGIVSYIYYVNTDIFSIHEVDDILWELGYQNEHTLYYHLSITDYSLDYDVMPLGNDRDVLKVVTYVPKHRLIRLYIENGHTRVPTYFKSPSKAVIVYKGHDYSKTIVPFITLQVSQQSYVTFEFNHEDKAQEWVNKGNLDNDGGLVIKMKLKLKN